MKNLQKLNLGCGNDIRSGYINVDKFGNPPFKFDLETFPWPWETNSIREILLIHTLEHLGETTDIFFNIIKEMYRVCVNGASLIIHVPHPRNDDFFIDPTHVRPITPAGLNMFSRRYNLQWVHKEYPTTPLGLYLDVDIEVVKIEMKPDKYWARKLYKKEISEDDFFRAEQQYNNVVETINMQAIVYK